MSDINAVIFDCDGVIIDSEMISAKMLQQELRARALDLSVEYITKNFVGRSYPVVLAEIQNHFGVKLSSTFEADYRARLLSAFERELKIMPHIREVVASLNVPYALATSSSPARVRRSLEIVGMTAAFEGVVFTSSQVARGKPAPDLFLLVARELGVDPKHCLVIEDSLTGVKAGQAAFMQVMRFIGGSHLRGASRGEQSEYRVFNSFEQFYDLCPRLKRRSNL